MRNIVISLFGSSIIEGRLGVEKVEDRYYMILQKKLSERFPEVCFSIVNGAIGAWSTRELMGRLDEEVLRYSPDYCIVMFGANNDDQVHPERILAEGEFKKLMEEFQQRMPGSCQCVGVVLNPIINELHAATRIPEWQNALSQAGGLNEMAEKERQEAREFYKNHNYPVADLAALMAADPLKYICSDGIHLSPAGHRIFADKLFEIMEKLILQNGQDTNGRG